MLISNVVLCIFMMWAMVFMFFVFDEIVLKGYFATKLRKRFNVEDLK